MILLAPEGSDGSDRQGGISACDGPDRARRHRRPRHLHGSRDSLRAKLGDALPPTPDWLRDKVHKVSRPQDRQGLYVWKDGQGQKTGAIAPSSGRQSNIARPQLGGPAVGVGDGRPANPADGQCLRRLVAEGIVDNSDVVDGAMIFGTGFAPFRGGPLNYAVRAAKATSSRRWNRWREIRRSLQARRRLEQFG